MAAKKKLSKTQILTKVIDCFNELPKPAGVSFKQTFIDYANEMRQLLTIANRINISDDINDMRIEYRVFKSQLDYFIDRTNK